MDVIRGKGVKIPNAVLIRGITETDKDEEIVDFLKQYGSIARLIPLADSSSVSGKSLIVEYNSGSAVHDLQPLLPRTQQSSSDSNVTYSVVGLASVYTQKAGKDITQAYLDELRAIAKSSGKGYEEVLKEMLTEISETITTTESHEPVLVETAEVLPDNDTITTPSNAGAIAPVQPQTPHSVMHDSSVRTMPVERASPSLSNSDLNPPDVQRVVVEHIVRNNDSIVHGYLPLRLRTFSGRTPRPSNEVDYDTWRASVELLLQDPAVSDLQRVRKICDSVYPPASDIIKSVSSGSPPGDYVKLLDSAFSTMEDGDELFAKFMGTFQNTGEKPSMYLQRLQVALTLAVKRGGVPPADVNKHLVRQFCRGCWSDALITELQLEQKKQDPPSFTELLTLLRTKENKNDSKATRMKQHLGANKQHVTVNSQISCSCQEGEVTQLSSVTVQLTKQVAELQSQLATLTDKKQTTKAKNTGVKPQKDNQNTKAEAEPKHKPKALSKQQTVQPRPWYCFKCGEDGHIARSCSNEPNPALVADKKRQLQRRQSKWESNDGHDSLN